MTGACGATFFPLKIRFARSERHPGQYMLETPVQGLVIHGAAHLAGDAAPVGHIVPDAYCVLVSVKSVGHRVQKLLRLFSPFAVHVLQPGIEHQPASRGQPEVGAVKTANQAGFPLAAISLGLQLVNTLVKGLEEIEILDLGCLAV